MAAVTRLITAIVPHHYRIDLDVDLAEFSFSAHESITFELKKPGKQLVFHGLGLEIRSARLADGAAAAIEIDEEAQTVGFVFDEPVAAGDHTLELELAGELSESLHGFYRSSYEQDGQTKWLATTQFEPAHAREAFICIDEPAAKAVFELSLTVPEALTAISNAPVLTTQPAGPDRKTVEFAPTPKMSTYLVAYIVGELEYVEQTTPEGVLVRVYATPGKQPQLAFALETAARTLSYFNEYFGLPYPLPKLDMIAVPDFGAGAMENWGAVTYRETALLLDPAQTSLSQKQRVAEVIAHELAHQWFGNLVTMAWWDDLWLNEGFASWVEVLAQDHLFPEWQVWTQFVGDHYMRALGEDSLANTHPIEVEVEDPRALDEIFDGISYSKGASIINMLHAYLGADDFQRGLALYLKKHQYGNAVTADLWAALGAASGQPVAQVMAAWTSLPGYPVLAYDNGQVSQRRFYASPAEATQVRGEAPLWPVPFSALLPAGQPTTPQLLADTATELDDELVSADWFKPNPGQSSFYRSHYTAGMIEALAGPLTDGTLPAIDRCGVVSDVFATTQGGLTDTTVALQLLKTLRGESDYIVWSELAAGLGELLSIIEDDELRASLEQFGQWFNEPARQRVGWTARPSESAFNTLLRPMVLQQAIRFDDAATIAEARRRFAAYVKNGTIDPDLRVAVYAGVARHGAAEDFDTILDLYRRESIPQVKLSLLATLGRFRQPALIQRSLELGLSADVRPQDTIYSIAYGFMNRQGRDLTWQFTQDHWDTFVQRYGAGGHMLDRFPAYAGQAFATKEKAAEVGAFFAAHPHPTITRPTAQAVESIALKADWFERDKAAMKRFLQDS